VLLQVLHLDSGMVPSSSLFRLDEDLLKEDELVIVPAFELDVPEMKLPQIEDKDMLKKVLLFWGGGGGGFWFSLNTRKAGDLSPLHVGHHILSTHSTDYAKWSACTEDYRIRPVVSGALAEELGRGVTEVVAANGSSRESFVFFFFEMFFETKSSFERA
jgi:hypothetical protein